MTKVVITKVKQGLFIPCLMLLVLTSLFLLIENRWSWARWCRQLEASPIAQLVRAPH